MKTSVLKLFAFFFSFFILASHANSQIDSVELSYFKSIENYQEQDSLDNYLIALADLRRYYKKKYESYKNRTEGKKKRAKKLLELFENYTIYREPVTEEEKLNVRKYYSSYIYWIKNGTGNIIHALSEGIKATTYVNDAFLLDKYAYNIEMQVGTFYARQGDDTRAILYYDKCIEGIKARGNHKRLSYLYANIGDSYLRLEDYKQAQHYLHLGIEAANKIECLDCYLANSTKLRDVAYEQRDFDLFLKLVSENRKTLLSYKNNLGIQKRLVELDEVLGIYYYNQKQFSKALPLFIRAKKEKLKISSSNINREIAKTNLKIAQCYKSLNKELDFKKEISNCYMFLFEGFKGTIPPDSILYAENTFMSIFSINSDFFEKKYLENPIPELLDSSLLFLEKAIKVGVLLDQKIIYSDSKSFFVNESKKYVNKAIELAFQKHATYQSNSSDWFRIRKLFNASKDQILKDRINLQEKIKNLDPQNKSRVDNLVAAIISELGKNQIDKKSILNCQDQIEKITGLNFNPQSHEELKGDYLEYLITSENVFLLARIEKEMHFLKLGTKNELNSLIDNFNIEIRTKKTSEKTETILIQLSNFLLPDHITLPKSFKVIPDENITTIPFDLLIRNNKYIIEGYTTSVSTHYLQKKSNGTENSFKLFCVNPEYTSYSEVPNQEKDRSGYYPLPFAKEEVNNLKSMFSSSFSVEKTITPIDISKNLEDANVFHFTGHAKVNKDSAYLVLNDEKGLKTWSYEQIYHNNFNLSLVTLSACETGLGQIQHGDGLNSVARSFLGAGSDAVVYSLWTVNDMSTSTIMNDFYSEIKKGIPKDEAIRFAKLNYLKSAPPERRHPYFWGGFVSAGDMSPLQIESGYFYKYILVLGFVAMIYIFFKTLKIKHP